MATERQAPDAILVQTGLSGAVTDIDDDPDSADGLWLTTTAQNQTNTCSVSFPTPTGNPTTGAGLQEFRVQLRKSATNNGKTDDGWTMYLYENGSQVGSALASGTGISTSGQVVSGTWDAADLSTADGSQVECRVVLTPELAGTPGNRGCGEVGAVEWNVDYTTGQQLTAPYLDNTGDEADAFYSPTVTFAPLIAPYLDESANTFYSPTLALEVIAPHLDESTDTFYAPQLNFGITAPYFDDSSDTFYTHTVTGGGVADNELEPPEALQKPAFPQVQFGHKLGGKLIAAYEFWEGGDISGDSEQIWDLPNHRDALWVEENAQGAMSWVATRYGRGLQLLDDQDLRTNEFANADPNWGADVYDDAKWTFETLIRLDTVPASFKRGFINNLEASPFRLWEINYQTGAGNGIIASINNANAGEAKSDIHPSAGDYIHMVLALDDRDCKFWVNGFLTEVTLSEDQSTGTRDGFLISQVGSGWDMTIIYARFYGDQLDDRDVRSLLKDPFGPVRPTPRKWWLASGASSQSLTAPYLDNTGDEADTFYAPTVTFAPLITPYLDDSADTFYTPTLALEVTAPHLDESTDTFYTPQLNFGLTAPHLDDSADAFYAPTVRFGSLTAPHLDDSSDAFYTPTLALFVEAPHLDESTDTFYTPTLALEVVTPYLDDSSDTLYTPTVTGGTLSLATPYLDDSTTDAFYSPTLSLEVVTPYLDDSSDTFYTPQLNLSLVAGHLDDSSDTFYAHTVTPVLSVTTPYLDDSTDAFYSPALALAVVAPHLDDSSDTFYAPSMSLWVVSDFITSGAALYAPTVTTDAAQVIAPFISAGSTVYAVVSLGNVSLDAVGFVLAEGGGVTATLAEGGPTKTLAEGGLSLDLEV